MLKKAFNELGLSEEVLRAVTKMGFEEASPIQTQAIPTLLAGRDVVGQSQTGSGKTAAFAIPAVERTRADLKYPQVLIMCPTRELALQVAEEVAKLAVFKTGVRELPVYGGSGYDRQFRGLKEGAQIIIGTPGRIMDHLERGSLDLSKISTIILDEADRMLDMGFVDDIQEILSQAPKGRQTVLFSATIPKSVKDIIHKFTNNPEYIRIEGQSLTVPAIDQVYYEVHQRSKLDVLCRLIDVEDINYAIIFCTTKMTVDELTEHLTARGYAADKIHGDLSQPMRERVIARFKSKKIEFLVATDVAARGLDVDDVGVVFNYDLPHDGEDYVHRIGRTGRAGKSGKAISFVAGRDIHKLQFIQKHTKAHILRKQVPTADEVEQRRADRLYNAITEILDVGTFDREDSFVDRLLERGHTPTEIASALLALLRKHIQKDSEQSSEITPPHSHQRGENYPKQDRGGKSCHSKKKWRDEKPSSGFRKKSHPAERRIKKRGFQQP